MPKVRALKEQDIIRAIMDFLDLKKILYLRHHPMRIGTAKGRSFPVPVRASQLGAPDLILFLQGDFLDKTKGRVIAVEVKRPGERQSPEQIAWQERLEATGTGYMIAYSVEDVMVLCGKGSREGA